MTRPGTSLDEERYKLAALIGSVEMYLAEEQPTMSCGRPTRMSTWKMAASGVFLGIRSKRPKLKSWTGLTG